MTPSQRAGRATPSVARNLNRLYVFLHHPHSAVTLAQLLHVSRRQVATYLARVGDTEWGRVGIAAWYVHRQGNPTPYYAWRMGAADMPRPTPRPRITQRQADAARYARLRDSGAYAAHLERRRMREWRPRVDKAAGWVASLPRGDAASPQVQHVLVLVEPPRVHVT